MDYETHPLSRNKIREFSKILRKKFKVPITGRFPVLDCVEMFPDVFENSNVLILSDFKFKARDVAQCYENPQGGYTIEIRASVYDNAYKGNGACLGFICHEISHVYLFTLGYKPIHKRSVSNNEIVPYRSVEWQAMALASEVMMPYEETEKMSEEEIIEKYCVSKEFADYRISLKEGGKHYYKNKTH